MGGDLAPRLLLSFPERARRHGAAAELAGAASAGLLSGEELADAAANLWIKAPDTSGSPLLLSYLVRNNASRSLVVPGHPGSDDALRALAQLCPAAVTAAAAVKLLLPPCFNRETPRSWRPPPPQQQQQQHTHSVIAR